MDLWRELSRTRWTERAVTGKKRLHRRSDHLAEIVSDYDARLSQYAYLVSLLPQKIIRDLG